MTATKQNKGLGNPAAVIAAAQSPAGQDLIKAGVKTAKVVAIVSIVAIVGYVGYKMYKNRFISQGTNKNYDEANITDGQAQTRAEALYNAMVGAGANFDIVKANLAGLNYNGWVKVYNAFGKRPPYWGWGDMDLTEWIIDQFGSSKSKMDDLRTILNGVF